MSSSIEKPVAQKNYAVGEPNGRCRMRRARKAVSLISEVGLAIFGISRRSWTGAALASAGGYIVYRGIKDRTNGITNIIEVSYTINRSAEEIYRFLRHWENILRLVPNLVNVHDRGPGLALIFGGRFGEFEIRTQPIDQRENQFVAWESMADSAFQHRGSLELREAPGKRGTEATLAFGYQLPGGGLGRGLTAVFGEHPEQQVREGLRRLKQLMETGEIATTAGQPTGRRGIKGRILESLYREKMPPQGVERSARQPMIVGD